jgi:TRAP-type C4-dicarboxylate transport system substrate-binding protein
MGHRVLAPDQREDILGQMEFVDEIVTFVRRVPPALQWRTARRLQPIQRSSARRELSSRIVRLQRGARPHSNRAKAGRPLVLRFANAHGSQLQELRWFQEAVEVASSGDVRIEFVNLWTTADNQREETATMLDVTKGRADLGWAGTRAFGCLGVRSLDPLQAPMLFPDYSSVTAACAGELADEMLEPLERLNLRGLVVLPGPFRKPFAFTRRLLGPRDYEGTRLRIHESVVADVTYRSAGAAAVVLSVRQMASDPARYVDGLDIQTEALLGWRLKGSITYNVDLWPRTIAIAASRRTFEWLGSPERELLTAAARHTLERAVEHLRDQRERDRRALPDAVNAILASPEQVEALREKVEPAHEDLRRHPDSRAFFDRLQRIVEETMAPVPKIGAA